MKYRWTGDRMFYRVINIELDCRLAAINFSVEYTFIANSKYLIHLQYFFQFDIVQEKKVTLRYQ